MQAVEGVARSRGTFYDLSGDWNLALQTQGSKGAEIINFRFLKDHRVVREDTELALFISNVII